MIVNGRPILANPPKSTLIVPYNTSSTTYRGFMNFTRDYAAELELHVSEKVATKRLLDLRALYLAGNITKTSYEETLTTLIESRPHPRIIVIGDVHGCVSELRSLLRRCDYHPGDLLLFLGDLVSKGPSSKSVIKLARTLKSLSVRGNHDFEVVRWSQAIKNNAEPPLYQTEHYTIARTLSEADIKYMSSLPWYITCPGLNSLFVHAGFVSGVKLKKQNPRLMMNMRSILPDGTVTSKFFENWPWARLWDGTETVYFGHDADRGLQSYDNAVGLDTGAVYGGRLTACVLPERRMVSVSARKAYFMYRRKRYT
ncbi:hypothetical protein TrVE_jg9401 [Triparma verrucosa]|uniref:Calcineurin-like phosphoesterase domain-containing protein n=1 Tax=Triparma verrucosa TaxID=1606542 RepID=A0A9W7CFF3_9STRA|nr:hypothetical protein TrVE_jg9401 [Triparma verrucosa]